MMILPVIVGIVFGAYRLLLTVSSVPYDYSPNLVLLIFMACWGGLSVLVVQRLWWSARRRRWWTFGVTLAILSLMMVECYWESWSPLGPSERLGWDRWYLILIGATLNTGLLIVTWTILRVMVLGLWRGTRAVVVRVRPWGAGPSAPAPVS